MIASLRGLAVLTAIAVALLVALLVSAPAERTVIDRTVAPGFDTDAVTQLVFARTGEPPITLERDPTGWHWTNPERSAADSMAVNAALAALRGAHWHRRAPLGSVGVSRGELQVIAGPRMLHVGIGAPLPGTGQTWIMYSGHRLLVDQWVADALLPPAAALRVRDPGRDAPDAHAITDGTVTLEGTHLVKPAAAWIDEATVNALTVALADIQFTSFDRMEPGAPSRRIEIRRNATDVVVLEQAGTCAGGTLTLIASTYGSGCVETAAWQRVLMDLARFAPPQLVEVVDARPLPFMPANIAFADGTQLALKGQPRIGTEDADPEGVAFVLADLTTPGTVRDSLPPGKPVMSIVATDAAHREVALDFYRDVVVRRGERYAIVMSRRHWWLLTEPSITLRDPVLWREDVTTLSSMTLDGITYTRGAVIGEWTRMPAGPVDAALVDALAESLARVRGRKIGQGIGGGPSPRHHLRVTFTPPAGAPTTHVLWLQTTTDRGCDATVDDDGVHLDLPLCMATAALSAAAQ